MNDEMLTIIITIMMVALSSIYLYINRQKTRSPLCNKSVASNTRNSSMGSHNHSNRGRSDCSDLRLIEAMSSSSNSSYQDSCVSND
jgi:hypothetical protein